MKQRQKDIKDDLDLMEEIFKAGGDKVKKWTIHYVPHGKFIVEAGVEKVSYAGVGKTFADALDNLEEEYLTEDEIPS